MFLARRKNRYVRTTVLGIGAMAVLVWAAVEQFGISRQEITGLFIGSALIVIGIIASAAVAVALWMGLRWLLRRGSG